MFLICSYFGKVYELSGAEKTTIFPSLCSSVSNSYYIQNGCQLTHMRVNRNCLSKSYSVKVNVDCRTARGLYRSGFTCKSWDHFIKGAVPSRCDCYQCPVGYASPVHDEITMARKYILCRSSPAGETDTGHCMLLPSGVL